MPIQSVFCKAGVFRLSVLSAALAVALPCYGTTVVYTAKTPNDVVSNDFSYSSAADYGIYATGGNSVSFEGKSFYLDTTPNFAPGGWGNGNVGVGAMPSSSGTQSVVTLGKAGVTDSVTINVSETSDTNNLPVGLWAKGQPGDIGGKIVVEGKNLTVNGYSKTGSFFGVYAQDATTPATGGTEEERATIIINAENTVINVASGAEGAASGLVAMSQGIIKVNGNLEVNADDAIVARGGAIVRVNEAGDKTVKLNGNIDFNFDKATSGTVADADVLVNLNGAGSYWNGNAVTSYGSGQPGDPGYLEVSGLKLGLSNGAQWNPSLVSEHGDTTSGLQTAAINNLSMNGGVINLNHGSAQTVRVDNLAGTGGTVNVRASTTDGTQFDMGKLSVDQVNSNVNMAVNFTGITADDVKDMTGLKDAVQVTGTGSTGSLTQLQSVQEGIVNGAMTQVVDGTGNVVSQSEAKNTGTDALQMISAMNFLTFRAQMNDVSKRMGDLRTMPQADGMWARAIAGQSEYKNIHNTYQTLQVGADKRIGDFYVGATASYTDGDGSLENGSTDDKNYSFGLYGGWMGESGQYVDVIVKRHKLQSEYDIYYQNGASGSGSMDTWGTSASVEYGWRLGLGDSGYYVEPQAELMLGHLSGTSYTNHTSLGNARVKQDGIDTVVGRLGVAAGWVSPDKTGSAYVRASVLHDWEGEAKTRVSMNGRSMSETEDMGGTWGEFALGGTFNINKSLAAYGEIETTAGNPVRTTYQVSGGIRYSF